MSVFPALAAGRRAAEGLMRATVRVSRSSGESVLDPVSLREVPVSEVVYEGRGKVQSYEAHESNPDVAGSSVTRVRVRVDVPVGAFDAVPNDSVLVVENPDDPALVGAVFRVAGVAPYKSMATAYRIFVDGVAHG